MLKTFISQTPLWVYILLIYLLFIGFKATKTNSVSLVKLSFMPAIFFAMSIHTVLSVLDINILIIITWVICLLMGVGLGQLIVCQSNVKIDKETNLLTIPGTWSTFILIIIIFIYKYWINFEMAVNKEILENKLFDELLVGSSALFPGIFLGKFLFYLQILKNCKVEKKR